MISAVQICSVVILRCLGDLVSGSYLSRGSKGVYGIGDLFVLKLAFSRIFLKSACRSIVHDDFDTYFTICSSMQVYSSSFGDIAHDSCMLDLCSFIYEIAIVIINAYLDHV